MLEDGDLIKSKLKDIVKKAEIRNVRFAIPTFEERKEIRTIITEYIRKKRRVIFGGTAIEKWVKKANQKESIYASEVLGDIEFYSPRPLEDMYNICNILQRKKFKNIVGREAIHPETYSIFVENTAFCDISYMTDAIVRNNIPTTNFRGVRYTNPEFLINDMYRVFSNPLHDYPFRLEKVYGRYLLLQKNYFNPMKRPSECNDSNFDKEIDDLRQFIFDKFVIGNKDVILSGTGAYDYYIQESKYPKNKGKPYKPEDFYDTVLIVDDIKSEALKILKLLGNREDVIVREYTKFFQFFDRKLTVFYQDHPIITFMGHNNICTPYHTMKHASKFFQIVSFDSLIQYINAMMFRDKLNKDKYYCMFYWLFQVRNHYLSKNDLTGIEEDNLFSHFIIDCKWITKSAIYLKMEKRKKKYAEKKGPISYEYRPENKVILKAPDKKYMNASGNQIIQKGKLYILENKFLPDNIK